MNKSVVQRPKRWDEPLSAEIDDSQLEFVLSSHHFRIMGEENFPSTVSLRDIIRNDCRIRTYEKDQLIVRAGTYLNSAFIILTGNATMVLAPGIRPSAWGRVSTSKPSIRRSFMQWLTKPKGPEMRNAVSSKAGSDDLKESLRTGPKSQSQVENAIFIKDLKACMKGAGTSCRQLNVGHMFGESAVIGRNEMNNTIVAKSPCVVLEIRWQGLRELRRRESDFKEFVDELYRKRGLYDYLIEVPLLKRVAKEKVRELAKIALFECHGEFEWHTKFQAAAKKTGIDDLHDHLIEAEPIVAQEGHYPDGLLLVRNGFGRISRKVNHGHYTFGHLSCGDLFGLEEIYESWTSGKAVPLACSFRALGYTDVIRIPSTWLEENIFKSKNEKTQHALKKLVFNQPDKKIEQTDPNSKEYALTRDEPGKSEVVDRKFTEFVVEKRLINGTKTMMIDLERCVRCDDCVTACANAHDNNPRFNRHGPTFGTDSGKYMIANACMHCVDPVCMIGCPTGAIHRSDDGVVSINDATCIGCSTCANSCPYDNIRMVAARDENDMPYVDERNVPILKATKCDLCSQVPGGPACERACSHDALTRIDLKDITKLADWINR